MDVPIPKWKAMRIPFKKPTGYYKHKNMCMYSVSVSSFSLQKNNEDKSFSFDSRITRANCEAKKNRVKGEHSPFL